MPGVGEISNFDFFRLALIARLLITLPFHSARLRNFRSIKAMATSLGGQIIRLKIFPVRSATRSDGVDDIALKSF